MIRFDSDSATPVVQLVPRNGFKGILPQIWRVQPRTPEVEAERVTCGLGWRWRERERCFKPFIIFYKSLDLGYPLSGQDHFSPWNHLDPKPQASSHLLLVSRRNVIQCMKRIWFLSHYTRLHLAIPAQSLQFRSTQAMLIAPSKKEMAVCTAME